MARLFGTDGVRGLANRELTAELALKLGQAAARVILSGTKGKRRAIVGYDSRVSGEMLSVALSAGLLSIGVDVINVGIITTPGIAYLSNVLGVELGVVISASHNPMQDNGIKFFTNKGFKLDDSVEDEIEKILYEDYEFPIGKDVGRYINDSEQASNMYVNHLLKSLVARESPKVRANGRPLEGLKICVDAANGAASLVGPMALRKAGAEVIVINASPDGYNINDNSGSTHPEQLQAITKASGADMGVAFDGDADRCIAVDANGEIVDGDKIIAILAKSLQDSGALQKNTVVVTVMSNKGFLLAMENAGINTIQANVGDRYVLEEMLKGGYNLGGEQSGHVINLDAATTGDGVLTALNLALSIVKSGKTLTDLASIVKKLPQALVNVANVDKTKTDNPVLQEEIRKVEDFLGDEGRVLLRPSGTEPLVRVMVEAKTQELADGLAQELADTLKKQTGL